MILLLTRKNRKLTDRKRKFKVSKLSSLYLFAEGNTHPHLDLATCTWTDCVGHSFSKYCCDTSPASGNNRQMRIIVTSDTSSFD